MIIYICTGYTNIYGTAVKRIQGDLVGRGVAPFIRSVAAGRAFAFRSTHVHFQNCRSVPIHLLID